MTLIEFLDSVAIHNALSTLLLAPERVVLFSTDLTALHTFKNRLEKLIRAHDLQTVVEVRAQNTLTYTEVMRALEEVIALYPDCVFDLTGGETELLVAMGALSQKYGIPIHTIDPENGTYNVLGGGAPYPPPAPVELTPAENVLLYGGKVTEAFLPPQSINFWTDVLAVWSVCQKDTSVWNTAISALHIFCSPEAEYGVLRLSRMRERLSMEKADKLLNTLHALKKAGAFSRFSEDGETISFSYKSYGVRYAMMKEGSALELYTFYAAYIASPQNAFTSGEVGVVADWETRPPSYVRDDVVNEIDVFLMRGHIPVFISCKNGFVDADELYKLSVVADRFGGPYAKKAIVITKHRPDLSFLNRAEELGILVVQNVHDLSPAAFTTELLKVLDT